MQQSADGDIRKSAGFFWSGDKKLGGQEIGKRMVVGDCVRMLMSFMGTPSKNAQEEGSNKGAEEESLT